MIYTRCMEEGAVPQEWKSANVTPIYKKGSKGVPGNYRLVSLTCILCIVMESVIRDAVAVHLTEKGLIRLSQYIFMGDPYVKWCSRASLGEVMGGVEYTIESVGCQNGRIGTPLGYFYP